MDRNILIAALISLSRKQVGDLYHFTSFQNGFGILESDTIKVGDRREAGRGTISLTRDKHFKQSRLPKTLSEVDTQMAFKLNGNKLSSNYKIKPHQATDIQDESEEMVFKDITNVSRYLEEIIVFRKDLENLTSLGLSRIGYEEDDEGTFQTVNDFLTWLKTKGKVVLK